MADPNDPEAMAAALQQPQQAPGAELRAYHPSWRDMISSYLLSPTGEQPSVQRRQFTEGLMGSSGLGHTSGGLVDWTPPGAVMNAKEASDAGHPVDAAMNLAGAVAPVSGKLVRGAANVAAQYPKAAAAVAGLTGAATIPAEAGSNLTPRQQRKLELEQTQAKNQAELAQQNAAAEQKRKIEADAAAASLATKTADERRTLERQQAEADALADRKKREAEGRLPFREKYPNAAAALPYAGMGVAAALPYGSRLRNLMSNNRATGMMENSAARAEAVLAGKPSAAERAGVKAEMKTGLETPMRSTEGKLGPTMVGALLGGDIAALAPQEYDLATLPKDDPNRKAAFDTLTNPAMLAERMAPALLGGGTFAKAGGYAPLMWPERHPPTAQMSGLLAQAKAKPK